MNATNQPHTDTTTLEASSAERSDFDVAGFDLFSELAAIELARLAKAGGKELFCRLPSALRLTLRARLTAGGQ
jgi:hypothetical protein